MFYINDKDNPMKNRYSKKELRRFEKHIEEEFGTYHKIIHETISPDIHLDIIIVPPTEEQPFYKLITMGAGAYKMKVPKPAKRESFNFPNAEYVIFLPKEWNLESNKPEDQWPINQLRSIGRLALQTNSWLSYGHTIQANTDYSPIANNTLLNSFILLCAYNKNYRLSRPFKLSFFKTLIFYQLFPIYQEELDYRLNNSMDEFLDWIGDENIIPIVDLNRPNYGL